MKAPTFLFSFLLIVNASLTFGQTESEYLKNNAVDIDLCKPAFQFDEAFYSNDLFFFGFVHGSEKPQLLDVELLKDLHRNKVRYYAPEVDFSLAFFLNEYLATGDESLLDFAVYYYQFRVPQDASIEFKNKWKEIYEFNAKQEKKDKTTVIGTDFAYAHELSLTHLAFIAPEKTTGVDVVDSLKLYKNLDIKKVNIISGKPVYKSGKGWDYFFGSGKSTFYERFVEAYTADSTRILEAFGNRSEDVRHLMNQAKDVGREQVIYRNFKKLCLPLIAKGEKVYANFGYFHIHQDRINGGTPLAKYIKDNHDIKLVSIIGMLTKSDCLKGRKYKSTGPLMIKGVKFKGAEYSGYKTSKTYDGDHLFERVNGIKLLKEASGKNGVTLFKLDGANSPYTKTMKFADFKRGGKNWRVEPDAVATDYFQYIILIKNSAATVPLQEEVAK